MTTRRKDPWPCRECGALMLGCSAHAQQPKPRRYKRHEAHGLCTACHKRASNPKPPGARVMHKRADVLEDWHWIDHDPTVSKMARVRTAAPRLGMSPAALLKALQRAGVAA
jgi:hypothetical protein